MPVIFVICCWTAGYRSRGFRGDVLEARALVRLYKDLLEERTSWQQRVHATLFHQGIPVVPKLGTADGQRDRPSAGP